MLKNLKLPHRQPRSAALSPPARRLRTTALSAWLCTLGLVSLSSEPAAAQESSPAAAQSGQPAAAKYSDSKFDFSIEVGQPWKSAPLQGFAVPGTPRVAYQGADGATIVIFMQEPGQAFDARFLLDASVQGMEQGLGVTTKAKEVRSVAGKQAMWMVVEGKGTGGAIDGKGQTATVQHWVAIPREKDIVVVLLTCPAAEYDTLKGSFEAAVKSLVVGGQQTDSQSKSK